MTHTLTYSSLVNYAGDNALSFALTMSKQTLREATDDLKAFAATATILKINGPQMTISQISDGGSAVGVKESGVQP